MTKFTKKGVIRKLTESLVKPQNSAIVEELNGALELVENGEFDQVLERSFPDYPSLEKTLRELWKERTTGVPHSHRWATKMAPNLRDIIRTCLTCGEVDEFER